MWSIVLMTLVFGVLERVGLPRFLTIPYVVAFVSKSRNLELKPVSLVFVAGIVFDLVWQSRLGVASFMFLICLVLFDQLKYKFANLVVWISGLVSVVVSLVYFVANGWPIVWWQLVVVYGLTLVFNRLINSEKNARGEVFLRRP